jgi:hypothetical protein
LTHFIETFGVHLLKRQGGLLQLFNVAGVPDLVIFVLEHRKLVFVMDKAVV